MNPTYTFSLPRLFAHFFLLIITQGAWFPFGLIWEGYRLFKK